MNPRGRPRVILGPSERVDVRVPLPIYDALCSHALRADVSLSEILRRALIHFATVSATSAVGKK